MKIKRFLTTIIVLGSLSVYGQDKVFSVQSPDDVPKEKIQLDEKGRPYYYDEKSQSRVYQTDGELLVEMDDLILTSKPQFNNQLDKNYYIFLGNKLHRVYPLFLIALTEYRQIQQETRDMTRADQRRYVQKRQNELADRYEKTLRDLTTTEGRVFTKLLSRATGKSAYEIIRELRGGWSAFWWNVKGNIADVDLKTQYDPHRDRSDEYLEYILKDGWEKGYFKKYPGYEQYRQP